MKEKRWVVKGETEGVTGACTRCEREFPAIGLIPVDRWVNLFGKGMVHVIGWFCAGCMPRQFGRINGTPSMGWVSAPLDGSDLDQSKKRNRMLDPMGSGNGSKEIKHRDRNRTMRPMKPLA